MSPIIDYTRIREIVYSISALKKIVFFFLEKVFSAKSYSFFGLLINWWSDLIQENKFFHYGLWFFRLRFNKWFEYFNRDRLSSFVSVVFHSDLRSFCFSFYRQIFALQVVFFLSVLTKFIRNLPNFVQFMYRQVSLRFTLWIEEFSSIWDSPLLELYFLFDLLFMFDAF